MKGSTAYIVVVIGGSWCVGFVSPRCWADLSLGLPKTSPSRCGKHRSPPLLPLFCVFGYRERMRARACACVCLQALTDFVPFLPDALIQSKALDLIMRSTTLLGDSMNVVALGVLGDGKFSVLCARAHGRLLTDGWMDGWPIQWRPFFRRCFKPRPLRSL